MNNITVTELQLKEAFNRSDTAEKFIDVINIIKQRDKGMFTTIDRVSKLYGIPKIMMYGKTRKQPYVEARMYAMYLLREDKKIELSVIGREFGRDHATVINAVKVIKNRMRLNQLLIRDEDRVSS